MDPAKAIAEYTSDIFAVLEEFFARLTGTTADKFCEVGEFSETIKREAHRIAPRGEAAFAWLNENARPLYGKRGLQLLDLGKQLGGMNLVVGGNSRFSNQHLRSVSASLLLCDAVFIPDPVMPWLEVERREEKFSHTLIIETVQTLLRLKPLVDAGASSRTPIIVFPSYEKSFERDDATTQEGQQQLVAAVVSSATGVALEGLKDIIAHADKDPEAFCDAIDRAKLFVAPNSYVGESLTIALRKYERDLETWRSKEYLEQFSKVPTHRRVILGVTERVAPMFHLIENSETLHAQPLVCLPQQAHYFRAVGSACSDRLASAGALEPKTKAALESLASRRLQWLGGIPPAEIATIRAAGENVAFRSRLASAVGRLHESSLADVDTVAAEVALEIDAAIIEHERDMTRLRDKYKLAHANTLALAAGTVVASLVPALAPVLGLAAPLVLAAKYGADKANQVRETRLLTRSLTGVLAAHRDDNQPE